MKDAKNIREFYREQGRKEMFSDIIKRFEDLHDEYLAQGDEDSANLVVDLVAWLQDDEGGISDEGLRCLCNRKSKPV